MFKVPLQLKFNLESNFNSAGSVIYRDVLAGVSMFKVIENVYKLDAPF